MPSSLVKSALTSLEKEKLNGPAQEKAAAYSSSADEEIRKIAQQLDVSIKIIGCGGGGCNTINRCVDEGINGAQLCGINTDVKHLLTIRTPSKILIGKATTRGLGAGAIPRV
ncbi:MAG TPA: cell division protein FtsZ, partial [Methanomassiliicoccales archaeon]|nr:cell division protein FtsZ [Methanomassiliicoccales archaeon]